MTAVGKRLALQLYTARRSGLALAELLPAVRAAGYDGVESADLSGVAAGDLRRTLADNELALASAHVSLNRLRDEPASVIDYFSEAGAPLLVVPWLAPDDRPTTADGWRSLGAELGELAARVAAAGFGLAYHNHDFELSEHGGVTGLELLADAGRAGGLGVQLDLGWVAATGRSPVAMLGSLSDSVVSLHIKDVAAFGTTAWEDVGHGAIDWSTAIAAAPVDLVWLVVEHDDPADPLAAMRRSATALRALLAR